VLLLIFIKYNSIELRDILSRLVVVMYKNVTISASPFCCPFYSIYTNENNFSRYIERTRPFNRQ
jgi:hypothetical protein